MDKFAYQIILFLYVTHFMVLTYYQEFLFARQPWFRGEIRTAHIAGFGKCKLAFGSRAALEHYTIVSYSVGNQEYIGKIFRSVDDQLDKKVILAVSGNVAARYGKCNWYIGHGHYSGKNKRGINLCKRYISLNIFLQITAMAGILIGCIQHDFRFVKMYLIYILVAIFSYVFLKQMIEIRNFMWKKDIGGMKIDENEYRKGGIAFLGMASLLFSLFLAATIIINRDVEVAFQIIVYILLLIFFVVQLAKDLEEKEKTTIPESKTLLAEVIFIDNTHETKKLICQVKNEQEVMQYQKIQYINFLEKIGDFVEVRVELADVRNYEVFNKIGN